MEFTTRAVDGSAGISQSNKMSNKSIYKQTKNDQLELEFYAESVDGVKL